MVAEIPGDGPARESLLEALARQAARAPRQELVLLAQVASVGVLAAVVTGREWPVLAVGGGALCGAMASLALWELCGRSGVTSQAMRHGAQRTLVVLGVALWFLSGMALLLAMLGIPWQS